MKFAEISRIIGSRWAILTTEEKKPFEVQAAADHKRWEEEKKNYVPPPPVEEEEEEEEEPKKARQTSKTKHAKKQPQMPDPPKHPGIAGKSPRPMALPPGMIPGPAIPLSPEEEEEDESSSKKSKISKKRKIQKDPDEPKKQLTPYFMFLKEKRMEIKQKLIKDNPNIQESEFMKVVGEAWRNLPPEEKEYYTRQSHQDHERYQREKSAYDEKKKEQKKLYEQEQSGEEEEEEEEPLKKRQKSSDNTDLKISKKPEPQSKKRKMPDSDSKIKKKQTKPIKETKDTPKDTKKGKILKVRAKGEDFFDRIFLKQCTLNKLIRKIQEKRQDFRPISLVIHLPDVRIRDNQDVACLGDNDELEVLFGSTNKNKTNNPASIATASVTTETKENGKNTERQDPPKNHQQNQPPDDDHSKEEDQNTLIRSTLEQKCPPPNSFLFT